MLVGKVITQHSENNHWSHILFFGFSAFIYEFLKQPWPYFGGLKFLVLLILGAPASEYDTVQF